MGSMFFDFNQKQTQSMKQLQRLMMSPQMQQAIHLMQAPLLELSTIIEGELEQNPVLEYDEEEEAKEENREVKEDEDAAPEQELTFSDDDFDVLRRLDEDFRSHFSESENYYTKRSQEEEKLKSFMEQSITTQESLFEHLMVQARETFDSEMKIHAAETLIGNLNESGFLKTPLMEIALTNGIEKELLQKVLKEIQTFDPYGVGARDLRECLLIQMRCRKETDTLAYSIVDEHFDDLLHNRIPNIKKGLKVSVDEINAAVHQKISHLDLHPGATFSSRIVQVIVPDVTVKQEDDTLQITVNDERLPMIRLNSRYLRMLDDESLPKETKEFIKNKLMSAKWLLKNIDQRNETLYRVVEAITQHQKEFFVRTKGKLVPLTMKTIAEELDIHESTVARAVSNKYVDTPNGILPLRYFFTNAYTTSEGLDISSKTVRDLLKKIIDGENKKRPLSDESISKMMEAKGISCARRTVAKYRAELNIGNAKQRKEY